MFACIYGRTVPEFNQELASPLIDLAFTFSPLVEQTSADTVVLDISGQELLFGPTANFTDGADHYPALDSSTALAYEIVRRANQLGFKVNVAVAANPDTAIHAARSCHGVTIIAAGEESLRLGNLPLQMLDYALAEIGPERVEEINETLELWGLHTFSDFARLPLKGIAQRLGQAGVRLQKLARGQSDRQLIVIQPPIGFKQTLELEYPVTELDPLSFIFSRLLNQLCANLHAHALATNELRLCLQLEDKTDHERLITLPVPMRNPKTLLRLLLFEIELQPPQAAVISVTITAEAVPPRLAQTGLFVPLAPEPEKLELTLARLAKLVGADKVGSPELLDTHRPDAFRLKRFRVVTGHRKLNFNQQSAIGNRQCFMGFRIFRPPWRAEVQTRNGRPERINAPNLNSSCVVRGKIIRASGPWHTSGDWWRADVWARDEWDIAVAAEQSEVLCRLYREWQSEEWFVEGVYD